MRRTAGFALSVAITFVTSAQAETMTPEQMVAVIQRLQSRVDALEARSRHDRADAAAAKAELQAVRDERAARRERSPSPVPAAYAAGSTSAPATLISKNAPVAVPFAAPTSSFDGFYTAIFGGYQFGTEKQLLNGVFSSANVNAIQGGSVGAAAGYNVASGRLFFGLEGRFRKEFDETVARGDTGAIGADLPRSAGSSCCFETPGRRPLRPGEGGEFDLVYQLKTRDAYRREYGGDISGRLGMIFDDTLLYTRIGAGANAIRNRYKFDTSGSLRCVAPTGYVDVSDSGFARGVITGCAATTEGGISVRSKNAAQPYGIIGLGVEHNYGPYFARLEGAVMHHFATSRSGLFSDAYYTTEVTGAVGVRF